MAKKRQCSSGFTLVELIITTVISGILFVFIGMIVVYSQQAWQKAADISVAHDDFRYFKKRMEYQLHNATTYNFSVTSPTELRYVTNNGGRLYINRVWLDADNTVKYENWTATTQGNPPSGPDIGPWQTEVPPNIGTVMVRDAQSLQFTYAVAGSTASVKVALTQNTATNSTTGATVVESGDFIVTNRN